MSTKIKGFMATMTLAMAMMFMLGGAVSSQAEAFPPGPTVVAAAPTAVPNIIAVLI